MPVDKTKCCKTHTEEKEDEEEYLAEEKARADYAESFKEKNEKM